MIRFDLACWKTHPIERTILFMLPSTIRPLSTTPNFPAPLLSSLLVQTENECAWCGERAGADPRSGHSTLCILLERDDEENGPA